MELVVSGEGGKESATALGRLAGVARANTPTIPGSSIILLSFQQHPRSPRGMLFVLFGSISTRAPVSSILKSSGNSARSIGPVTILVRSVSHSGTSYNS